MSATGSYLKDKYPEIYHTWWSEDILQNRTVKVNVKIGWIRIAWTQAFLALSRGDGYYKAVKNVMAKGGDTDTNAAIVGGLIGAADGLEGIPDEALQSVLNSDNPRPEWLRLKSEEEFYELIDELMTNTPTSDTIKFE